MRFVILPHIGGQGLQRILRSSIFDSLGHAVRGRVPPRRQQRPDLVPRRLNGTTQPMARSDSPRYAGWDRPPHAATTSAARWNAAVYRTIGCLAGAELPGASPCRSSHPWSMAWRHGRKSLPPRICSAPLHRRSWPARSASGLTRRSPNPAVSCVPAGRIRASTPGWRTTRRGPPSASAGAAFSTASTVRSTSTLRSRPVDMGTVVRQIEQHPDPRAHAVASWLRALATTTRSNARACSPSPHRTARSWPTASIAWSAARGRNGSAPMRSGRLARYVQSGGAQW